MPYKVDRVLELSVNYGIPVVEDSAEALGSRFNGKALGTFGRFGVLSFNGNKMITTSGGGALICPDSETKKKMLHSATQARELFHYQHENLGYNYLLSNVCAGIGRGQMLVANEHVEHHRRSAKLYAGLLKDVPGIHDHGNPSPQIDSNFWLSTIVLDPQLRAKGQVPDGDSSSCETNPNVMALIRQLDLAGIETRPLWKPMHRQPLYQGTPYYCGTEPISENLFRAGICLPSGPRVTEEDIRYICEMIRAAILD